MKRLRLTAIALFASSILAASCVIPSKPSSPNQGELIAAGARLFSEGRLDEAGRAWSALADPDVRSRYLSFLEAYSAFDAAASGAEKALSSSGPEAALAAVKAGGNLPAPPTPIDPGSADPRGAKERLDRIGTAASRALVAQASEAVRAADADLDSARSGNGKNPVASAGKALGGFEEAGRLYRGASSFMPQAEQDAKKADAKARIARELRERLAKESLLSFPDRMGEVFARYPSTPAKMSDKDILAFNAETQGMISAGLSDFDKTVADHPGLLDSDTIERLRGSAQELSARFALIESAIKAVKDRGKPVMPLIIGVFNPQPKDPQRSRPAAFSGRLTGGSDWWWGIADIPKGLAQDLVIAMSDSRPVRIYAAGQGPGSTRPASDLVNPLFKVGNSWPVLNAGARLDQGVFHIEVGPGESSSYSGEAVVYKSFMTRTR